MLFLELLISVGCRCYGSLVFFQHTSWCSCLLFQLHLWWLVWPLHSCSIISGTPVATILWDSQIITDRHVPCNKPDIVIQEKKSDRYQIIDVAIPSDYNIHKKATEDKQVCRSPDWVPETMEQEGRGHTSHHRCNWNSKQEHQEVCWKNTRLP